jgi:hypothetical protein
MIDFRCPHCHKLAEIASSEIGGNVLCPSCRTAFLADDAALPRFEIPTQVAVAVRTVDGKPWTAGGLVFLASRGGLSLPPLRVNLDGEIVLTRHMFDTAVADTANAALMDFHDDYRLVRYLEVRAVGKPEGQRLAEARRQSGWPIQPQEAEMYGTMAGLLEAFVSGDAHDGQGASCLIDLEHPPTSVELRVPVRESAAEARLAAEPVAPSR